MEIELNNIDFKNDEEIEYLKEIPIIENTISYDEFFRTFLIRNQVCLIRNISANWNSSRCWVDNNLPNFQYLNSKYGCSSVNIQNYEHQNYHAPKYDKWIFQDYIHYWESYIRSNYSADTPLYYLKDWHMQKEFPEDNFYEVPLYFSSDWINEYLTENSLDDYRFVYMGVKGTWTPLHVDVMNSYSWSTNVCGQKKWILFPPGEEKHLLDPLGNLPSDISTLKDGRNYFEVIQNPGDAIFVPSNWHHQVWNLKDTISINHNWINGTNLKNVWHALEKNLFEVKEEISDCKDMEGFLNHCQVMLKASFGMNLIQFYEFLMYIASKRLNFIETSKPVTLPGNRILGRNHVIYDLSSIKCVLNLFIKHEDIHQIDSFNNVNIQPKELLEKIETALA